MQQEQTRAQLIKARAQLKVLESTIHTMSKESSASREQIMANSAKVKSRNWIITGTKNFMMKNLRQDRNWKMLKQHWK